ncbi:MAG: aldo/keto reductase [Nitrospirae bacterium]|nr:aldo/keto reductase [Nitrospirota bacterium]
MQYRSFGSIGWNVSAISTGTYAIGGNWGPTDDKSSIAAIRRAFDLGVNFFDTADVYGLGKSETLLSEALAGMRTKFYIATKGGRDFYSAPPKISKNFDVKYLAVALDRSLGRLKTDNVDLYQLHGPTIDQMKQGDIFEFVARAKQLGKVRACGVSLNTLDEVRTALSSKIVEAIQYPFSILNQNNGPEVFALCKKQGVALIVREPLAQGLLTGKYTLDSKFPADDHRSREWTREFLESNLHKLGRLPFLATANRSMVQAALQFILSFNEVSTVIPGPRNSKQLEEHLGTFRATLLTKEEISQILQV